MSTFSSARFQLAHTHIKLSIFLRYDLDKRLSRSRNKIASIKPHSCISEFSFVRQWSSPSLRCCWCCRRSPLFVLLPNFGPVFAHDFITLRFYSSLKLECEKLAQEKTEIQRQYIMVRTRYVKNVLLKSLKIENDEKWIVFFFSLFTVLRNVLRSQRGNAQAGKSDQSHPNQLG